MLIRRAGDARSSEISDERLYWSRRELLAAGGLALGALAGCGPRKGANPAGDDALTPLRDVTTYDNYYEFGTDKGDPAKNAKDFRTEPWSIRVEGLVKKPATIALDDFLRPHRLEERIYRHRCVEAWSMVIPWLGFPVKDLLSRVEPLGSARFVEFTTLLDPARMPGQRTSVLPWPYTEGLRLDEAMHPLAIFAVGLYGKTLLPQNGAPLRTVIPWKYGFKGTKAIVRIRLTEEAPRTTWNVSAPEEYGFYANVNPTVDHPRWSQAKERRIGELHRRETVMFNGYGSEVASLYAGMDLRKQF